MRRSLHFQSRAQRIPASHKKGAVEAQETELGLELHFELSVCDSLFLFYFLSIKK